MLSLTHLAWWKSIGLSWSPWQHCSMPGPYQSVGTQGKALDSAGQEKREGRLRELSPAHAALISVQQLKTRGHKPNELFISFSFADMER
ncbi:hypothetical protein Q8A67_003880 [Cirrhinus molitorella]|uniref:Uncharacterized protein n=1 Tax=Cirrhinus molitorella TaxID=172907 RepID=A0AA88TYA2_9TELE|nr:hypothetical protein Q8A67_003880 [Cirrhinus molitorella]